LGSQIAKICQEKKFRNQTEELVKGYPISGNVFTLDALHCQKETTTLITESDND
jgi:predicted transposase YbfD/YdcC